MRKEDFSIDIIKDPISFRWTVPVSVGRDLKGFSGFLQTVQRLLGVILSGQACGAVFYCSIDSEFESITPG
jgi:hypothetical protein